LEFVFDYPDIYRKIIKPWITTIPGTTAVYVALGGVAVLGLSHPYFSRESDAPALRFLIFVIVALSLLTALVSQPYRVTRYSYFLYPFVIVMGSLGVSLLSSAVASKAFGKLASMTGLIFLVFWVAEDYRLDHLLHINDAKYRYRITYEDKLQSHYYLRWDLEGPANFVTENFNREDRVLVSHMPMPFYVENASAIFIDEDNPVHGLVADCNGHERWSNLPLLGNAHDVAEFIAKTEGDTWLILRTQKYRWLDPLEESLPTDLGLAPLFTSIDGHLAVYRIISGTNLSL
jgi:hypothetical protein